MTFIYEAHDCNDELRYYARRRDLASGSIFECECGRRFIRGKWTGVWRRMRWFDRLPPEATS